MEGTRDLSVRCGIVLAAGEGQRLQPLVHQLRRDGLPKQYVNFIGTRSMLEHTFYRVEKLIPPDRIFTVVSQEHLSCPAVRRQLSSRPRETIIAQPENKETGPGVLLPLMHLYKRHPESTVAIFPSDHFILEEDLFMAHVAVAFHAVERDPRHLILLGMEPDHPEPEYGYIVPDGEQTALAQLGILMVRQFVEKPKPYAARELIREGGLWNTMVMVCRTKTLLGIVRDDAPEYYESFQRILKAIGRRQQRERVEEIYRNMKPMNFSTGLLETLSRRHPSDLLVLPVHGVFWSDWGLPRRVEKALKENGYLARRCSPDGMSEKQLFPILNEKSVWKRNQREWAGRGERACYGDGRRNPDGT